MTNEEKIAVGAGAGGVAGFVALPAILSTTGVVAGTSASGITSALAAVGVGGMVGGVVTVAAVPFGYIAAGEALAYGGCHLARHLRK